MNTTVSNPARVLFAGLILTGGMGCAAARGGEAPEKSESGAAAAPAPAAAPGVEPHADRILREMSDYLAQARAFTFHADVAYDSVSNSGQKIQYGGTVDVAVRRPDRLHVEYRGDERKTRVVNDGRTLTLHDVVGNHYSATKVPSEIGAAIDTVFEKYGLSVPIADFVYPDAHKVLTENVQSGFRVGRHAVGGAPCHHLAFTQEAIDWQIWIEDGPRPVPRKIVVTYKDEEGSPQYAAILSHWDFDPQLSDHYFRFHPPAGAEQIDFLPSQQEEIEP